MKPIDIVLLRTLLKDAGFKTQLTKNQLKLSFKNKSGGIFLSHREPVMGIFNGIKRGYNV